MQQPNKAMALGLVLALASVGSAAMVEDNPLSKVLELVDSLATKINAEGEAEAKAFKEFVEWCDDASKNTQFAIKTATAKQASLEADIAKCISNSGAASNKIEELAASIATGEADLGAATKIRTKEAADFAASEAELLDAIDTLARAIGLISKEMAKNPAASFAQIDTTNMKALLTSLSAVVEAAAFSGADKKKLLALVQSHDASDDDDQDAGAPSAAVYKSHSTNILDVLEDMKEKAEEQLSSLRKAELGAKHNYDMLKQSLEDQTAQDNKDLAAQKSAKAAADGAKATADGDLAATLKDLSQSKEALQMANGECMTTAADHEATVKSRAEELAVIAQAKKILQESTGGAVKQSYSLLQRSSLQGRADLANAEVVAMVKKLANEQHSAALAQLAQRIAAVVRFGASTGDPFAKVKGLITDLVSKLESEAQADATEKAYCDEQIAKTTTKKDELNAAIDKLTTKIDQAAAASAHLKEEVKELQSELAALARTQAEMDQVRADEHASYTTAKSDLEQGLQGVRNALSVLREYYSGAAAMLQSDVSLGDAMRQPAAPEQHSAASGAGQSIIDLLEVCESDFAKNLAEEETAEADAANSYERISQENAITKTTKEQDVKYKTQEHTGLDKSISELSSDRETESTELAAVLEYFAKIKGRCIAKPETYEERRRRREAEIAGLKEALRTLEEETAFLQQRGKRNLRNHRILAL